MYIGPVIPTPAYLPQRWAPILYTSIWVYWPSGSDLGQAQRRSPSQATHVSHLDGVFYLLLHRHKIQGQRFTVPFDGRNLMNAEEDDDDDEEEEAWVPLV
jgi:hypothetical protein